MRVAIAGLPGSGKTTAARLVASELGLEHVSAGQIFRDLATERGISLEAFSRLAEKDHAIDRALDARVLSHARKDGVLLDGRLVAWVLTANHIRALRVWLACREGVRAERVAKRDGVSTAQALEANRARERSEAARYQAIYGVSLESPAYYDATVTTHDKDPEAVAAAIVREARLRA